MIEQCHRFLDIYLQKWSWHWFAFHRAVTQRCPGALKERGKVRATLERNLFVEQGKNTWRRGQTVKGLSAIHLLTCSRCAWLMSSSFGGEHMSTAAVPPSIGSDCALANCIPGSPAKSEWSELSHFLKRASAFHLIYMSHSPQSQWPFTGRSGQSLPLSMRSSSDVAHFELKKIWDRCVTAVTQFSRAARQVLLTLFPMIYDKWPVRCTSASQAKLFLFCKRAVFVFFKTKMQVSSSR